jgi:hypothetical protein
MKKLNRVREKESPEDKMVQIQEKAKKIVPV